MVPFSMSQSSLLPNTVGAAPSLQQQDPHVVAKARGSKSKSTHQGCRGYSWGGYVRTSLKPLYYASHLLSIIFMCVYTATCMHPNRASVSMQVIWRQVLHVHSVYLKLN